MKKIILALALIFGTIAGSTIEAGLWSWTKETFNSAKDFIFGGNEETPQE